MQTDGNKNRRFWNAKENYIKQNQNTRYKSKYKLIYQINLKKISLYVIYSNNTFYMQQWNEFDDSHS